VLELIAEEERYKEIPLYVGGTSAYPLPVYRVLEPVRVITMEKRERKETPLGGPYQCLSLTNNIRVRKPF
jgi:hypothetical protein